MAEDGFRSGFVAVVGRPNAGKSSLINAVAGAKLSIVSWHPNTTRRALRTVTTGEGFELILVDTPGTTQGQAGLGKMLAGVAEEEMGNADFSLAVVDASRGVAGKDALLLDRLGERDLVVLTKIDLVPRPRLLELLAELSRWSLGEYLLASSKTGEGVGEVRGALVSRLPFGPRMYDPNTRVDQPLLLWIGDLVREQLLRHLRDELPHAVECRAEEVEEGTVDVVIYVERESQKGIVIGSGGSVLAAVRRAVNRRMPSGLSVQLRVKVASNWQHDPKRLAEFGY